MLGNFSYHNPTKLYFGADSLDSLLTELPKYGQNVLLIYGGGSIKRTGLYDKVLKMLADSGKNVFEDAGVMPNPTLGKLREGCLLAKAHKVDFILAVGGGSVCDYAKAVGAATYCEEDPWEKFYVRKEAVTNPIIPLGCILTMVGTGSEMNGGAVITNEVTKQKRGRVFGEELYPKFSILNPELTYTIPKYQMVAGFFDIMSHVLEQYLSGDDDNTSDYIAEGLLRSLIHSSRIAVKDPTNYEARSNIMWTATWALNTLVNRGKVGDWMVHMFGHSISAFTDATHGMTLAAVSLPYYRYIMRDGLHKFKRFAVMVWGVNPEGRTDLEVASEGLARMEDYMQELGLVQNIRELGVTEELLPRIAQNMVLLSSGYRALTREEAEQVLKKAMS